MKRGREDSGTVGPSPSVVEPNIKRQNPSKSVVSCPPNDSQQKMTTNDALSYLRSVKDALKDDKTTYNHFLEIMKDFKAQRVDTPGVIERVKELFKDHRELVLGFNAFLPEGYEISVDELPKKPPVEYNQAIHYVNKIKTRFQDNNHMYKGFLEILYMYRRGKKSINEVYQEVAALFRDHPDLLDEFKQFLPDCSGVANPVSQEQDNVKQIQQHKTVETATSSGDPHSSDEHHDFETYDDTATKSDIKVEENEPVDRIERKVSASELDIDGDQEQTMQKANKLSGRVEPKRSQSDRGEPSIAPPSEKGNTVRKYLRHNLAFFDLLKSRLQNNETYQEFLKCLNLFSEEIISRQQLNSLVNEMLEKHPDLIKGFNEFVAYCESNGAQLTEKKLDDGSATLSNTEKERPAARDRKREREDRHEWERHIENEKDHKPSSAAAVNKFQNKPVSELDLKNCKQCTPSYRLLPDNYPIPRASARTPLGDLVLNDLWVSVTSGSEDYPFKHMLRNKYEESLFRCEDDRFELDMLLETTAATIERLEALLGKEHNENTKDEQISIDDSLTVIQLRCIERIYGEHGLDVLDALRKNAADALPVVLTRLKQKQEDWLKCRREMNTVWADVFVKNFHKALDHRSFYFVYQDKQSLSAKALLAEIKEINNRKRKDSDFIISLAAGNMEPLDPDLTYKYPELGVNEDLYRIIRHSCNEMCTTSEQLNKIVRLWRSLLEQIFGEPCVLKNNVDHKKHKSLKSQDNHKNVSCEDAKCAGMDTKATKSSKDCKYEEIKQENDKVFSETKKEKKNQGSKSDILVKISVGDVHQDQLSGEREEGEISPSEEAEEKHARDFDSASRSDQETQKQGEKNEAIAKKNSDGGYDMISEADIGKYVNMEITGDYGRGSESGDALCSESGYADDFSDGHHVWYEEEHGENILSTDEMIDEKGQVQFSTEDDKSLIRCKPLAVHTTILSSDPSLKEHSNLFYGNDNIYILLRLHQVLYERIRMAKVHALTAEKKSTSKTDSSPGLYQKFLRALYGLLDGSADNTKFEDVCRSIVGNQSYILATVDKLIFKIVKQLQLVASDDIANKLLALHFYEKSHAHGGILVDAVYRSNASMLLHGENIYRFEWKLKSSELFIQLMEKGLDRFGHIGNATDPTFSNYLHGFLRGDTLVKHEQTPVFLKRNKYFYDSVDEEVALVEALKNVSIFNGLEHKISCRTYKVSYVLDTEDLLHRKRKKHCKNTNIETRKNVLKFNKWLDSHIIHKRYDRMEE